MELGAGAVLSAGCQPKRGNFAQTFSRIRGSIVAMYGADYMLLGFFLWRVGGAFNFWDACSLYRHTDRSCIIFRTGGSSSKTANS